ncbi:MAG: prepilin-type N-terminal cleavage/methylation domain-containing protein [Nitrospirota bacterium]|jgi:prepilin-type N-terminal cleavage/methylation domain-containing protein
MRSGASGFTLIEVMLVVALVAVLAATLLIRNPVESLRLRGAATKVRADIGYARKLAVTTQQRAGVEFHPAGYSVYRDVASAALANAPGRGCSSDAAGRFVVDFTAPRCAELRGVTLAYSAATVAFDPLGSPVDEDGDPLASQTVTVSAPGGARTLTIEAQTGRVSE